MLILQLNYVTISFLVYYKLLILSEKGSFICKLGVYRLEGQLCIVSIVVNINVPPPCTFAVPSSLSHRYIHLMFSNISMSYESRVTLHPISLIAIYTIHGHCSILAIGLLLLS